MITTINNPRKVALNQFLWILDLHNKEKKSLIYYTPQDVFGKLKPGLGYGDCISALEKLDNFGAAMNKNLCTVLPGKRELMVFY